MANKEISELTAASTLDGTELVHVVQSGNSRKATVDGIVDGAFRTSATWSDVQVASASFKLFNAAGTPRALTFNTTALTADRAITVPDSNVDLADTLKARVVFDGTGTVAIKEAKNFLAVTDVGTGLYGPVFTTAAPHANYVVVGSARAVTGLNAANVQVTPHSTISGGTVVATNPTTAGFTCRVSAAGVNSQYDSDWISLAVFW